MIDNIKTFNITVDGSVSADNGKDTADGGFGFYVDGMCFGYGYIPPRATNNISELMAMLFTCSFLIEKHGANHINFVSDSKYVVEGCNTWVHGWERKDFLDVKNDQLWRKVLKIKEKCNIIGRHVHGHKHKSLEHVSNNLVDHLASFGRTFPRLTPTIITLDSKVIEEYTKIYMLKNTVRAKTFLYGYINDNIVKQT
jgi:ribonuclease HI